MAKQTFTTGQVLTAAQMTSLQQTAMLGGAASAKTDSYVLTAADAGTAVTMNKATATTITVNTGLFAAGDIVTIVNIGAGVCTVTAGTATISKGENASLALIQYAGGVLYFTATGAAIFLPFETAYSSIQVAGKNKIINGDFNINQRAFTSTTTTATYGFDRWVYAYSGGTVTYSTQNFTLGAAPVAGYEGKSFARIATTGQSATSSFSILDQRIESVRTLAGQTATISFWAKASTGTPSIAVEFAQGFGTGGSPSADVNTYVGKTAVTTSWARYSLTVAVPSISGKTIGTNNNDNLNVRFWTSAGSDFNARAGSIGLQNVDIDIWGVQVEQGSLATPFSTATGTVQGELAACQRYYWRITPSGQFSFFASGIGVSTTTATMTVPTKSTMRVLPTAVDYSNLTVTDGSGSQTITALTISSSSSTDFVKLTATVAAGLTQFRPYAFEGNNASNYLGLSAEL